MLRRYAPALRSMVLNDEPRATLSGHISPYPLDKNADSKIGRGEKLEVYERPGEPREESAEVNFAALQNGKTLANNSHVPFVEISEGSPRDLAFDLSGNYAPHIAPLLDRNLCDARQWSSVLNQGSHVAGSKYALHARHH